MRVWITIGLLTLGTSAFQPGVGDDGYGSDGVEALRAFADSGEKGSDEPVLGMVGFYGQPQPPQWLILTEKSRKPAVLRESVVSGGKVLAERQFRRHPRQDLPDIPISVSSLKVGSQRAFEIGELAARKQRLAFESVHFQLRCRDHDNEPVWMLSLIDRAQVSVGAVYISAVTGKVLRTAWKTPTEKYSSIPEKTKSKGSSEAVAARMADGN